MKCPMENVEGEELLLNYVSGALDTQEAASFDAHMLSCAACREFAHGQKAVWRALDLFEPASISADFDRRLYERIEKISCWNRWWDTAVANFSSPMLTHRGLPIAAAAAVLAIAGFIWEHPSATPAKPQSPLSAEVQTLQPDQVQHALDDMEMLREFNHLMRSEPSDSNKM
jgi:anti-sigma factor RsiW